MKYTFTNLRIKNQIPRSSILYQRARWKEKKRNLSIIVSKLVTHLKVTSSRIDTSITPVSSHLASISRSTSFRCSRKSSRTWTPSSSTVCRRWLRSTRWLSVHEGSPLWTWLAYPIDQPTIHTFGEGKRIGKQEGRNGKVSQDRCFFSKSRVRCPLNRNVGKVKLILSFSAYLSFLLFIFLSLSRFRCNPIATSWSSVRVDALSNRWEKVWSVACNRIARLYSFLRPFCAPRL